MLIITSDQQGKFLGRRQAMQPLIETLLRSAHEETGRQDYKQVVTLKDPDLRVPVSDTGYH